jgi:hypothetical protein
MTQRPTLRAVSSFWTTGSIEGDFFADGQLVHEATREWVETAGIESTRWPLTGGQHVWMDSEGFPW